MPKSLKSNYLYNSLFQVLNIILPLLTAPYLSRVLGPEKIGTYAFSYSISYYFMLIAMLGINNYGNRSCAMARDDKNELSKTFWEIYTCQLFTGLLCCVCYFVWMVSLSGEMRVVSSIMILNVISAVIDINWFFFGMEEFKLTTMRNIFIKICTVGLIFIFVKSEADLGKYTLIMSVGIIVTQVVMWPFLPAHINKVKIYKRDTIKHIKQIVVLFIPVIAVSIYKVMDKVMLGYLSNMVQTGYYENTEKLINMPLGLINALGIVMLPRMSSMAGDKDRSEANHLIDMSMLFVSFLSIAMTFGLASIAPEFVPLFFGENFRACVPLVITIAPTMIFFSYANVIRTQYLLPNKKDKSYIISVLIGAIVNLAANTIFIPKYEALGAVIGTLIAEATVCVLQMYFVRQDLNIKKYCVYGVPFIIVGVLMSVAIRRISVCAPENMIGVIIEICVGIAVYCFLSGAYIFFSNKALFLSLMRKIMH
ncbi:MAG: flippase [Eubacteriales bacterium]|nr:flippase [Eubacteriales bacterium]